MSAWEKYLEEHREQYIEELMDFLRIPSVSALPENTVDIVRAAEWVANRMRAAGLEGVEILPTGGHPVVTGEWLNAIGKPTILIYGHFDTQPVDPIDQWISPPFQPEIREGRIYARGATDDKGNLLLPILAVESLLATEGALPVNVKFFIEGQEEIGSPQIPQFLRDNRDRFSCDMVFSADSLQWSEDQPLLILSWRGLCGIQIDIKGGERDIHSGLYGGAVQNPLHALVSILASMHSSDGRILVDGFYDSVKPVLKAAQAQLAALPYDEAAYKSRSGLDDWEMFGEPGFTTYERVGVRSTLEINGIWGGFQGQGSKTVIPNEAHAKITCRLVADQKPAQIVTLLKEHVKRHTPPGVTVSIHEITGQSPSYLMPIDHPGNLAARAVLEEIYGKSPFYVRPGGTLPICSFFLETLGAYTIGFAFCIEDEQVHAPNEFFRLSSYQLGQKAYCLLLNKIGEISESNN